MPLIRRLIKVGNSRAVVIPPSWLRYYEEKAGQPIDEILMELNDVITLAVQVIEGEDEGQEPDEEENVEQANVLQ